MKIAFTSKCRVSNEDIRRNEAYAGSLGHPNVGRAKHPRLAVVAGGPSILEQMDEIAGFDGEIWAINGAFRLLADRGIEATFFTIDPTIDAVPLCVGAKRSVVATCCNSALFRNLHGAHVDVVTIGPYGLPNGPTSASTVPVIAIERGNREVTLFGCESSFGDTTHAYSNPVVAVSRLLIECNGERFLTAPDMFMQAEMLSEMIRAAPVFLKERSGGLLRAMVESPDYDIVAASQSIHDALEAA